MPSEEFESAAAAFTRIGQDAVTHSRRVRGTALARNQRHHGENAELLKRGGRGADPTPGALRAAAERFRRARGLPVAQVPVAADPVPVRPEPPVRGPRSGDDDEDFSELRIMKRDR